MHPGEIISIGDRTLEMISVNHTVPAVGYRVESGTGAFAFSGDTTTNDSLWEVLNGYENIDLLFVESAFSNNDLEISKVSRHYCPKLLGEDILKIRHRPEIWLTHFKPGEEELIYQECVEAMPEFNVHQLKGGEVFKF
jgi:ribonuclease BN (tRNA processing enzyme)